MICPKCGESIHIDDKKCEHCKEKIKLSYSPDTANDYGNNLHRNVKLKTFVMLGGLVAVLSVFAFILIKFIT